MGENLRFHFKRPPGRFLLDLRLESLARGVEDQAPPSPPRKHQGKMSGVVGPQRWMVYNGKLLIYNGKPLFFFRKHPHLFRYISCKQCQIQQIKVSRFKLSIKIGSFTLATIFAEALHSSFWLVCS